VIANTIQESNPTPNSTTPRGPGMMADLTIGSVELAVDQFELHVHRCDLCLVRGNSLCMEGGFIAEDVATLRAKIERPMKGPQRRMSVLRRTFAPFGTGA